MTGDGGDVQVCVVGAGPRGLSILERLCANERHAPRDRAMTVHVVDPAEPGAGSVWRTGQSCHLLMNTVASQITVYTDDSVRIAGPVEPGPSLYDWAEHLVRTAHTDDEQILAEAREVGPDSYPTRALYGRYLRDSFDRIVRHAPAHVQIRVYRSRVVAMADTHGVVGGPQGVRLEDGTRIHELDAIVMAQGHLPSRLSPQQARTASLARIHYLTYLPPANPADMHLDGVQPGQAVLLRGLGLNFFDHMALFTVGRGGTFVRDERRDRLAYRPSGREPKMYAFSRRGVPYHARGSNEKGPFGRYHPRLLTAERVAAMRGRTGALNFTRDLWPIITKEVESVYYGTLLRARGRADSEEFVAAFLATDATDPTDADTVLTAYGIDETDRWSWERISRPYGERTFADRDDFRGWLLDHLEQDVREARRGNLSSPVKAALDVLRDLRNEVRLAVDHGGLDGGSHRDDLEGWYTPLNAYLSIGPPASRIEEMIALIEAGLLELTGPGTEVRIDTGVPTFLAHCRAVPGPAVPATVLIEARLPEPDLRRTADPLLTHLLHTEQCIPYQIVAASGTAYETGGLAVTERPYHLVDAKGRAHPRRFAYGVPTESVHWATAAGIRPGVDSVTLSDSDAIARAVLALPPVARVPAGVRPPAADTDLTGVVV